MSNSVLNHFTSCILLINPTRFPNAVRRLKRYLQDYEIPRVMETKNQEHFIESVKQFSAGDYQNLLVWGGDGTVHQAINALMNSGTQFHEGSNQPKKSIGFLRGGSGNGIQDSYEEPFAIRKQLKIFAESIARNYTIDVDLLEINDGNSIVYGQLAGFGFDAAVLKNRETRNVTRGKRSPVSRSGIMNYVVSAWRTYQDFDLQQQDRFTLKLYDGKYALRGTRVNAEFPIDMLQMPVHPVMMEVGTRPYYGRMFKVCPDVVCNDGNMDLYLFNFEDRTAILYNLFSLWNGRHHKINQRFAKKDKPLIERYEIKRLEISSMKPFNYHIDGELKMANQSVEGQYSLSVSVKPRAISFLVPRTFYKKFHPFDGEDED